MAEDSINEIWRVVEGYPNYAVSNLGRAKRLAGYRAKKDRVLKGSLDGARIYINLHMCVAAQEHCKQLHRLVCEAFHGTPPTERHHAAHNDGNPLNCRADNLRWATPEENQADRVTHGTSNRGSRNPLAKLNESQVQEIRKLVRKGVSSKEIASQFNVNYTAINHIMAGRNWAWLPDNLT